MHQGAASVRGQTFKNHRCEANASPVRPMWLRLYSTAHRRSRCRTLFRCCRGLSREEHNQTQAQVFTEQELVNSFTQPLPPEIEERLSTIVNAAPGLGPGSRVLDVGCGTGCLIPHLQQRGVRDIVAVDLSEAMLSALAQRYPPPGPLGNHLGVRTWLGDIVDLPPYMGPVDAAFFNAMFGNMHNPKEALLRTTWLMRPGGLVVISHPLGRSWVKQLHDSDPVMVPHVHPDEEQLRAMVEDLPLRLIEYRDDSELYLAVLQVPPHYQFPASPLFLEGKVVTGFGRGSRQLGTPTANLDPLPLENKLRGLHNGVYFGFAQLLCSTVGPEDRKVVGMVMNIGRRPTVNTGEEGMTVEVHLLHRFERDFYGEGVRLVALGYLRPEVKFSGIKELMRRIQTDIGLAKNQLADPALAGYQHHEWFTT